MPDLKTAALGASLWIAASMPAGAQGFDMAQALEALGGAPCELGALTCVTLPVARDHFANDPTATINVTFAVSPATEDSKGVLFYVVGGPGGSGLASADDYLSYFDASLTENMDIVFFDQRGIGAETGLECPAAGAVFDTADLPLDKPDQTIATTKQFVADCLAELASQDLLAVVSTEQAIRDLEDFRLAIGAPQVWIYGESYGTQFAQQYATAFPEALRGVILDGVVDLNLSFAGYYDSYARGAERILARLLAACASHDACRTDMQGDAVQVHDALAAQLKTAPVKIALPLGDGTTAERDLTAGMLDANAFYALYDPESRAGFLRMLAAASRGDLLPMLRTGYVNLAIDPASGESTPDPTWYGAAYYAITCTDYARPAAEPEAMARAIIADAQALAPEVPRLLRSYYAEQLVCAFWPERGPEVRPEPFAGGAYPTLVMTADTDPITPAAMAYSVFENAQNAYLVTMQGGPHVIWGRGLACPDRIVDALLFDGVLPDAPVQICAQDFIGEYVPLTMTDPADAADPYLLAQGLKTELEQSPALYGWDGGDPLAVGCDFGGTVTISAGETGTDYAFAGCAWWKDVVIDGGGVWIENGEAGDGITLDLAVSGSHAGEISYSYMTMTEAAMLSGTYDGAEVGTPMPLP